MLHRVDLCYDRNAVLIFLSFRMAAKVWGSWSYEKDTVAQLMHDQHEEMKEVKGRAENADMPNDWSETWYHSVQLEKGITAIECRHGALQQKT